MNTIEINTTENRKLLHKYLTRYFITNNNLSQEVASEKAVSIIKKRKSNLFGEQGLSYWLGSKSIEYFSLYYLQDTFIPKPTNQARKLAQVHYDIWDLLQRQFIDDEFDKSNIVISRGCAKTTTCDLTLTLYLHCYGKSPFTVIGAKKDDDAQQFIGNVRKQFEENPYIQFTFGLLIDKKNYTVNKNEMELTNNTCIKAISSGSSVRGMNFKGIRPTTFIGDDYQDKNDVLNELSRDKKWKDWCDEIENFGDTAVYRDGVKIKAATKIVNIGTVMHRDCLISRLMNAKDYKTMFRRAIILEPNQSVDDLFNSDLWSECKKIVFDNKFDDPVSTAYQFYLDNKEQMDFSTLWDDKWDRFNDLAMEYWKNRTSFMQEKMNDCMNIGEKWFKSIRTMPKEEIESNHLFKKTILCIDPAGVKNVNKKKADSFAFIVGSLADNGFKYIRRGQLLKFDEFDDYINHVIGLLREYPEIIGIYLEKNTYNGLDCDKLKKVINENMDLKSRNITIINEMQRKNKDEKISMIVSSVSNGQIIFSEDDTDLVDQFMDFQGQAFSSHDDGVDCVAEFSNRIDEINVVGKITITPNWLR